MILNALPILLAVSILINILLIWYLRILLRKLLYVSENIYDFKAFVELYLNHLGMVSELEMYFQDPNIEFLTKHTEDLLEQLKSYEEFYDIVADGILEIPEYIKENEEDGEEKTQE